MRKGTVEIDKDELYKKLVYLAWFIHMEKEIKYLNTIRHLEEFENFKKDTDTHFGNCVTQPMTCLRCLLQTAEVDAQNILNYLIK